MVGGLAYLSMHAPIFLLAESELLYVWHNATLEGQSIIVILVIFSICAITDQAKIEKMTRMTMMDLPSGVALCHT